MLFTYKPEAKAIAVQMQQEEAIMNSHNVKGTNYKYLMLPTSHSFHKDLEGGGKQEPNSKYLDLTSNIFF